MFYNTWFLFNLLCIFFSFMRPLRPGKIRQWHNFVSSAAFMLICVGIWHFETDWIHVICVNNTSPRYLSVCLWSGKVWGCCRSAFNLDVLFEWYISRLICQPFINSRAHSMFMWHIISPVIDLLFLVLIENSFFWPLYQCDSIIHLKYVMLK